ncbi:aminotriazole resistance protein [Colletotrichum orchidophilum]|uniref:Aminotriazole resistance protein n=1 Tax=Colletotrichum orchidophilum TaxID=1209926 RepID=A0A1G4BSK9_9PEZI|nr:aminotriazole resistance protein [Colletotrichum orchidophilum]OHF04371.1 aminotriazole resistance protein [Colletotrichum orchidophilum]
MSNSSISYSQSTTHTLTTAWETRNADEAMQRVADMMIAVTESFRQQFREEHASDSRPFGPNGPGNLGWRTSAPVLVSPILDDDGVSPTTSHYSRPSTAPSALDTQRHGPVVHLSPTSSRDPVTTPVSQDMMPGPLSVARNPTTGATHPYNDSKIHAQRPTTLEPLANPMSGATLPRGLGPEALEHPSEYPDLFEAARRIVFTQRIGYSAEAMPLNRPGEKLRYPDDEERLSWAPQSTAHRADPLLREVPPQRLSPAKESFLAAVVSLYQVLMFASLAQAIAPALIIAESFADTPSGQHSWFTAAYTLTLGAFALPSERLGDVYGRKPVIIIGCIWFALWSLLAGFSINVQKGGGNGNIYFCFCRAMQGIGPALCIPNGFSILETTLPPSQKKDMALSLFSVAAPVGFVVGAVMSSLFAYNDSWEWVFFVLAAVCISAAGLSLLILPRQPRRKIPSTNTIWVQLDASGILLGGSGLTLFSFAWNEAPAVGWRTPYIYFVLIIGIMLFAAFIYNETVAANPLLPLSAMTSRLNLILGCTAATWGCFIIWTFYSFQLVEVLREWDPLLASAGFVPVAVEALAVSLLLAYLMPGEEVYWAFLVAALSTLLAPILMATATPGQTYWANTFVSTLLAPLGLGLATPLATILLGQSLAEGQRGVASGLVSAVSSYTMSLAMGVARTVEVQVNPDSTAKLSGFRGAQYFGMGLGGLAVISAAVLLVIAVKSRGRSGDYRYV